MQIVENFDLTPWLPEFKPGVSCFDNKTQWNKLRKEILKRDNYRCIICNSKDKLRVHHLFGRNGGGDDSDDNLITVCVHCHTGIHLARQRTYWYNKRLEYKKMCLAFNEASNKECEELAWKMK